MRENEGDAEEVEEKTTEGERKADEAAEVAHDLVEYDIDFLNL